MIINNVNKFNLKLIRTFIYLFQFRLNIRYKSRKSHIVLNALSRFSSKYVDDKIINSLDIENYYDNLMKMFLEFCKRI